MIYRTCKVDDTRGRCNTEFMMNLACDTKSLRPHELFSFVGLDNKSFSIRNELRKLESSITVGCLELFF